MIFAKNCEKLSKFIAVTARNTIGPLFQTKPKIVSNKITKRTKKIS